MTGQSQMTGFIFPEEEPPEQFLQVEHEVFTRSQRRAQRTRIKLLQAATKLFRDQGIDRTSIEQITEMADVGKGTFYRHFTTKEELLLTVLVDVLERLSQGLQGKKKPPDDLRDALDRILETHVRFFHHRPEAYLLFADWLWHSFGAEGTDEKLLATLGKYLDEIGEYLKQVMPTDFDWSRLDSLQEGIGKLLPLVLASQQQEMERSAWQAGKIGLRSAFLSACQAWISFRPRAVRIAGEDGNPEKEEKRQ